MKRIFAYLIVLFLSAGQLHAQHKFDLAADIVYASPEGFDLTLDVYTPRTEKSSYPVLVIIHGGGWLINNKSIMKEMAEYVASHAEYVVVNVNYRLLGDQQNTVTINEIVEDVFGSVLWVKDHIAEYKGDPARVAVTGDSAGGHLTEMVVVAGDNLTSHGFSKAPYGFKPSYLPAGKTAEQVAAEQGMAVQAAIPSYGAFDMVASAKGGFEKEANFFWQMGGAKARGLFGSEYNVNDNQAMYEAVSPVYLVPDASEKQLPPQYFHVGSKDQTTTPESVKAYVDKVASLGHPTEFWLYEGRNHAYLDSGSNEFLNVSFEKDAITALKNMIGFLDGVFYKK
jgi:acetyl esterase/lipase